MNELNFARKVRQALDAGTDTITPDRLHRLRNAREQALRVQRQPVAQTGFVRVGNAAAQYMDFYALRQYWLPLGALAIGLAVLVQWHDAQPQLTVDEADEIDSALLTSELPINAYLDQGFDAWLKRSSQE
jgi:hypothetical protein